MRPFLSTLSAILSLVAAAQAETPPLAFQPAGNGYYSFDTGVLRGKLKLDGRSQGLASVVDVKSGVEVAGTHGLPGIFSYYRVFSADTRYGDAARDWPTASKLLPDGAVEVRWAAAPEHPLEMTAVYRWKTSNTLDLQTTVKPDRPMPRFEVFLSNYFAPGFRASVYVKPNMFTSGKPELLSADGNAMVDGSYLMFPRDRQAVQLVFDRRWEFPPNPVQWSVTRCLAGPMALRRDQRSGLTAVVMAPPQDCFAVAMPYNKTPPDGVAGHASLYLSLFGQDLAAGQTGRARSRLVVAKDLSDQQAIELYEAYRNEATLPAAETNGRPAP